MNNKEYHAKLNELAQANETFWQVTIIATEGSTPARTGMKMLIPLKGQVFGNLGGGEMEHHIIGAVREGQPLMPIQQSFVLSEEGDSASSRNEIQTSMACGGKVGVFIEPMFSTRLLYIIGAGHCGRALAHLAGLCGYQTRLIDNRREILSQIPPEICSDLRFSDFSDLEEHITFGSQARIVIMTHGHVHDQHALEQCLGKPCRYLGMIGSATKVASTFKNLEKKGFSRQELDQVRAPIGIPIGSQTPYEIAVSILAELIREDAQAGEGKS